MMSTIFQWAPWVLCGILALAFLAYVLYHESLKKGKRRGKEEAKEWFDHTVRALEASNKRTRLFE